MERLFPNSTVESIIDRNRAAVDAIERSFETGAVIYGAGFVGTWAVDYLKSCGIETKQFIDRDPAKAGTNCNGVPVIQSDSTEAKSVEAMLIAARHYVPAVTAQFAPYGTTTLAFDAYFVIRNYQRLATIRDTLLTEPKSADTFNAILVSMLTGSLDSIYPVMEKDMYFSVPEFAGNFEETFVDAGAFTGDTVERFIWENLGTFNHLYAFEPGWRQFNAMQARTKRLIEEWAIPDGRISLEKAGLSSAPGTMACTFVGDFPLRHGLADQSDSHAATEAMEQSEVYTLDDYLGDRTITFLKADVEGMEMEVLKGARKTLERDLPKMTLCIYHYPSHLYEIAEFVQELSGDYRFWLRQHAPIMGDYVLYCAPKR